MSEDEQVQNDQAGQQHQQDQAGQEHTQTDGGDVVEGDKTVVNPPAEGSGDSSDGGE